MSDLLHKSKVGRRTLDIWLSGLKRHFVNQCTVTLYGRRCKNICKEKATHLKGNPSLRISQDSGFRYKSTCLWVPFAAGMWGRYPGTFKELLCCGEGYVYGSRNSAEPILLLYYQFSNTTLISSNYGIPFFVMGARHSCESGTLPSRPTEISHYSVYISSTESWGYGYDCCLQKCQRHVSKISIGKRYETYHDTYWTRRHSQ